MRAIVSPVAALVCALVAAAALSLAVLAPATSPHWIRDLLGLGHGEHTAATPWVRWGLIVIAIALLAVPHLWGRSVWPEVAVVVLATVAVFAAYKEHRAAAKAKPKAVPAVVAFSLPQDKLTILGKVATRQKAVVLLLTPKTLSGSTVTTYGSHRYQGTRRACATGTNLCLSVKRGVDDANASAFSADLRAASFIYVLPGATSAVKCLVPAVKNKPLAVSLRAIAASHCEVGPVRLAHSARVPPGQVIAQQPQARKRLQADGKVALVVSKGRR